MTDASALATPSPAVGVIGGSGLYELLDAPRLVTVSTPYGAPSGPIAVGRFADAEVAFLARHGAGHGIPPGRINYRANMWALATLGARAVIASSAVGSINPALRPDTFVVPDQLIDRTRGRDDTFFDADEVQHLSFADPFSPAVRDAVIAGLEACGESFAAEGTTAVIPGPRFSTRAESRALQAMGADIVNMTQYPEAALAAELGIGYASLSFITDMDAGAPGATLVDDIAVTADVVFRRLSDARGRIVAVLESAIRALPAEFEAPELIPRAATARVLARPPLEVAP